MIPLAAEAEVAAFVGVIPIIGLVAVGWLLVRAARAPDQDAGTAGERRDGDERPR